jgi:hypothetical protein
MVSDLDHAAGHAPDKRRAPATGCIGYTYSQLAGPRLCAIEAALFARTRFTPEPELPITTSLTTAD